jgi:hypothetical protein
MLKEKIIETKFCKHCETSFDITEKDLEFYEKVSPIFPLSQPFPPREKGVEKNISLNWGGIKGGVKDLWTGKIKCLIPSPTLCPQCREQRRFSWRNERNLYKRKCDFSGRDIISIYSPEKPYKVYDQEIWWSDTWWDGLDYGREFDFSRPFFEQFDELMKKVPLYALLNSNTENAEFNNYIYSAKNCYMSCVVYYEPENIYYSNRVYWWNNVIDCSSIYYSENCYDCYYSIKCFNCYHSSVIHSCQNCYYSRNLEGCDFCIGCANLVNKKYHIFNKPVSKEIFEKTLKKINDKIFINECLSFINSQIFRSANNLECENCSGDYLRNCKNVFDSYDAEWSEDCRFLLAENMIKCYDWVGGRSEYCYEFTRVWWGKNNLFSNDVMESSNIIYSFQVYYSNNCFW